MPKRASPYRCEEIIKLLQAAGWEARISSKGHTVLSKPGRPNLTLTDPVHKNGIAEVQRELGLHILQVFPRSKGNRPSRAEFIKRVILAKKMLEAGLNSAYVLNKAGLSSVQRTLGPVVKDLRKQSPEEFIDRFYKARMAKKGVGVLHQLTPVKAEIEEEVPKEVIEDNAMLELLATVEQRLEMLTRTDRLSLLGTYLEKLQLTLIDARTLKGFLEKQLEVCNRILERLEQPFERGRNGILY